MNSFGRIFRVHIFGESHGESVGIVIDGCPAGLSLSEEDLLPDLERRKGGKQKGTTPRQEADYPFFKSGVFNGKTTGAPITILFENNNTRGGMGRGGAAKGAIYLNPGLKNHRFRRPARCMTMTARQEEPIAPPCISIFGFGN
ncbi:TPA: chorismate synthase [Escherichia coli]|uniref:chorismate synthase n=1 Tax=Enterobacter TaxID=547 RepID=UPI001C400010|nr:MULTISPECIES: chorismate synthase [Enterobacter]EHT2300731.1 chorismate synthase [Escherichia coli]EJT3211503.1 chorismate synthase [Salmonella enterica]HDK6616637.1 chorismate synthase [Klebsiella variicola]EHT2305526.1 chorismate synthase [Escherichia coli]EHT2310320.1 chorismate synthase [Escherichia coli]